MKPLTPMSPQISSIYGVSTHVNPVVQRLSADALGSLRQHMLAQCSPFVDPALHRFLQWVFTADEMVAAYSFPKLARSVAGAKRLDQLVHLPFEEANYAAQRAYRSSLPQQHERSLTYVAALLLPCGMFYHQHPAFKQRGQNFTQSRAYWRMESSRLLSPALRELRWRNSAIADILATVLGFDCGDDCDPQQVARIGTAAYLPNEWVTTLWSRA